jgi:cytochrome P450
MVSLDPPAHGRLRRPTSRAFTPRRVAAMEPRVRATVDELLDAVDPDAPFDLVPALTFPPQSATSSAGCSRSRRAGTRSSPTRR